MYTLAGLANAELGWGRRDESWAFMDTLAAIGGDTWFRLGDRDLAVHVERTRRLAAGETLSAITAELCTPPRRAPARGADERRSGAHAAAHGGRLARLPALLRAPAMPPGGAARSPSPGAETARPQPALLNALGAEGLRAVIICPSNPFISIEPILAVPGLRAALAACRAPVIAVSPIVGGRAVKGPTAKMMAELGIAPSAAAVAARYRDLLDGYVIDHDDAAAAGDLGLPVTVTATVMTTLAEREALARAVLAAADAIGGDAAR